MKAGGVTVLGGGTGTPMLLDGLRDSERLDPSALRVVANTADDVYAAGARVCPDVDTVLYTLADLVDRERWYGIRGDTTTTHDQLRTLSKPRSPDGQPRRTRGLPHYPADDPFMTIGDRDRAVHLVRTALLERGHTLTEATRVLTDRLEIPSSVLPMTDDPVGNYVVTEEGSLHLQDFLVRRKARPGVTDVKHRGIEGAGPAEGVLEALGAPVLIGPSNPVTSVAPILALPGVREALASTRVVAVSPFLEQRAFSGPAAAFMEALGWEPSARGMARYYGDFLDEIILHENDGTDPAIPVHRTDIRMNDARDRRRVATRALERLLLGPANGTGNTP